MGPSAPLPLSHLGQTEALSHAGAQTFGDFYDEHVAFVWRNARRLLGLDSNVDDVVQQVFLVALRKLPEFEGRSSPRTWLYGILRRVAADHRRAQRDRGARDSTDLDAIEGRDSGPHRKVEKAEAHQLLHTLLGALDEAKREVFILAELEEMTAPQIAELTGANLTTVHARLRDARRKLREAAESYSAQEGTGR